MNRRGILIFICTLAIALAACGSMTQAAQPITESIDESGGTYYAATGVPSAAPGFVAGTGASNAAPILDGDFQQEAPLESGAIDFRDQRTAPQEPPAGNNRVILKNATLNITVQDVSARVTEISSMADEMGGWVVASSTSQSTAYNGEKQIYGNITVRVPAERLNEAMNRIKTGAETVNSENVSGQDVTQSYVDLSSRLTNLEAAEQQLQTIMDSARKVEDVLSVYNQLVSTRGEIESIKGQLNYYSEAAAYSSIQVTVNPIPVSPVTQQTTGWNPLKTVEDALGALIRVAQDAVDFIIFVAIAVLPPLLIVGVPVFLIFRRVWRTRRIRRVVGTTSSSGQVG